MNTVGNPPDMIRWTPRNAENMDCGVVALQLACGVTYEAALAAAVQVKPSVVDKGLTWGEIRRIARKLGFTTQLCAVGRYSLDEDTGILGVRMKGYDHAVYLWEGRVVEPMSESLWLNAEEYLVCMQYTAGGLLTVEGKKV